jgi:hypothetical protein
MFTRRTVFVLGAGASWHYGYPTGETLVDEIRKAALDFANLYRRQSEVGLAHLPSWLRKTGQQMLDVKNAGINFSTLHSRIKDADPVVIDYFLSHNKDLAELGKFLIAWILMEREEKYNKYGNRYNRNDSSTSKVNDNWLRFIQHKLTDEGPNADLLNKNLVNFVTFNYDISLERTIYSGLSALSYLDADHVTNFCADHRFIHIYGKLNIDYTNKTLPFEFPDRGRFNIVNFNNQTDVMNISDIMEKLGPLSSGINVIQPGTKLLLTEEITLARQKLDLAQDVYILGYGFDSRNNTLLFETLKQNPNSIAGRHIYFTNYGDANRINKVAGRLLTGDENAFSEPGPRVHRSHGSGLYTEKSIKSVYGALALDFDI